MATRGPRWHRARRRRRYCRGGQLGLQLGLWGATSRHAGAAPGTLPASAGSRQLTLLCAPAPASASASAPWLGVQVDLSKTDKLGNVEEAVIGKYAAADEEEEGAESGEEE